MPDNPEREVAASTPTVPGGTMNPDGDIPSLPEEQSDSDPQKEENSPQKFTHADTPTKDLAPRRYSNSSIENEGVTKTKGTPAKRYSISSEEGELKGKDAPPKKLSPPLHPQRSPSGGSMVSTTSSASMRLPPFENGSFATSSTSIRLSDSGSCRSLQSAFGITPNPVVPKLDKPAVTDFQSLLPASPDVIVAPSAPLAINMPAPEPASGPMPGPDQNPQRDVNSSADLTPRESMSSVASTLQTSTRSHSSSLVEAPLRSPRTYTGRSASQSITTMSPLPSPNQRRRQRTDTGFWKEVQQQYEQWLADLREKVKQKDTDNGKMKDEIISLKAQLTGKDTRIKALESQLKGREENAQQSRMNSKERDELTSQHQEQIQKMKSKMAELEVSNERWKEENKTLLDQTKQLSQQLAMDHEKAEAKMTQLTASLAAWKWKWNVKAQAESKLLADVQRHEQEERSQTLTINDLEAERSRLMNRIKEQEEVKGRKIVELQNDLAEEKRSNSEKAARVRSLSQQLAEKNNQITRSNSAKLRLEEQISNAKKEIISLGTQLDEVRVSANDRLEVIEDLRKKKKSLADDHQQVERQLEEKQEDIALLEEQVMEMVKELHGKTDEIERTRSLFDSREEERNLLKKENTRFKETVVVHEEEIEKLSRDKLFRDEYIEELTQTIGNKNNQISELNTVVAEMRDTLAQQKAKYNEKEDAFQKLQQQREEDYEARETLRRQVALLKTDAGTMDMLQKERALLLREKAVRIMRASVDAAEVRRAYDLWLKWAYQKRAAKWYNFSHRVLSHWVGSRMMQNCYWKLRLQAEINGKNKAIRASNEAVAALTQQTLIVPLEDEQSAIRAEILIEEENDFNDLWNSREWEQGRLLFVSNQKEAMAEFLVEARTKFVSEQNEVDRLLQWSVERMSAILEGWSVYFGEHHPSTKQLVYRFASETCSQSIRTGTCELSTDRTECPTIMRCLELALPVTVLNASRSNCVSLTGAPIGPGDFTAAPVLTNDDFVMGVLAADSCGLGYRNTINSGSSTPVRHRTGSWGASTTPTLGGRGRAGSFGTSFRTSDSDMQRSFMSSSQSMGASGTFMLGSPRGYGTPANRKIGGPLGSPGMDICLSPLNKALSISRNLTSGVLPRARNGAVPGEMKEVMETYQTDFVRDAAEVLGSRIKTTHESPYLRRLKALAKDPWSSNLVHFYQESVKCIKDQLGPTANVYISLLDSVGQTSTVVAQAFEPTSHHTRMVGKFLSRRRDPGVTYGFIDSHCGVDPAENNTLHIPSVLNDQKVVCYNTKWRKRRESTVSRPVVKSDDSLLLLGLRSSTNYVVGVLGVEDKTLSQADIEKAKRVVETLNAFLPGVQRSHVMSMMARQCLQWIEFQTKLKNGYISITDQDETFRYIAGNSHKPFPTGLSSIRLPSHLGVSSGVLHQGQDFYLKSVQEAVENPFQESPVFLNPDMENSDGELYMCPALVNKNSKASKVRAAKGNTFGLLVTVDTVGIDAEDPKTTITELDRGVVRKATHVLKEVFEEVMRDEFLVASMECNTEKKLYIERLVGAPYVRFLKRVLIKSHDEILSLDPEAMLEVARYNLPPKAVPEIVGATLHLLEKVAKDKPWSELRGHVKMSLLKEIVDFDPSAHSDQMKYRFKYVGQVMDNFVDLAEVEALTSVPVARFYEWANVAKQLCRASLQVKKLHDSGELYMMAKVSGSETTNASVLSDHV